MDAVERMVPVYSCAGQFDAELRRGALETSGIRAVIATDTAGGLHPELVAAYCGAVRILVPDHEADRARDLLGELDDGVHALDEDAPRMPAAATSVPGGRWLVWSVLAVIAIAVLANEVWHLTRLLG